MARSTKASNAVLRLKQRSQNAPYSMVSTSDGLFFLILGTDPTASTKLCDPLEIDSFVAFVNNLQKETPRKASRLDVEFEAKLKRY